LFAWGWGRWFHEGNSEEVQVEKEEKEGKRKNLGRGI
jgi:hypothetical protein